MKKGFLRFAFVIALFSIFLPIKVSALTFKVEKSVDTAKPGSEVTVYVKASPLLTFRVIFSKSLPLLLVIVFILQQLI